MIAYLGTGLLGSGFVRRLLERGETVRVWNRTPEKARALAADGAVVCATAAEAVRGADQIQLTLSDDASVDAVLEPLAGEIGASTIILDHTTTAPTPTGERVARWKQRGVTFVHTPVFMGPAAARNAQGFMLLSAAPEDRATVKPLIVPMTGKVIELGDDPTRAAAFKLFGNMMLVFVVTGLADGYRFAESLGIPASEAQRLFDDFKPGATFELRGKAMANGDFTPQWELSMARKDVRLMMEEAQRHGTSLAVLPAIAAYFDEYVRAGYGGQDVGVVARREPA
ncbi:MAG TPA: NAD(P)-dependent oxidoreductase [Candidatus Sulfotelmatobacter sp.]|nr:NAD(P)-dependent oxidoreductase [Candidatus Sulfotelmatobacter sp.]